MDKNSEKLKNIPGASVSVPPEGGSPAGPPRGMGRQNGRIGEIPRGLKQMAPDYTKMRRAYLAMNLTGVILIFICELLLFSKGMQSVTRNLLIIGTVLNFIMVIIQAAALKFFPKKNFLNNIMPVMTQIVVCTTLTTINADVGCLALSYCMPMFCAVVYYDRRIINAVGIASAVCLLISVIIRGSMGYEDAFLLVLSEAAIIVYGFLITHMIFRMMNDQKLKMAGIIMEAKKAQEEALSANKAKSLFLANMSHEIRTPINAILGMNEMILREENDPKIREYASTIYSSGSLLLSIISDVLDISKIESGSFVISNATYDISSLINDCYNMTIARAKKKQIELNVEFSEELPRLLYGDETQIRQIIVNLLTNAVKYTDEGSVIFIVFGTAGEGDDFTLVVKVRDTGIGISEEDQKIIFNRFTRFDLEHNRNIEGTGLGLTIVKRLVDMMKGEITLKSELGKGSEFTVKLPQKIIDATPTGHIEMNYSNIPEYEYVHSFEAPEARILAVDDLSVNLMVIANMLKETRMILDTARSGEDALEKARSTHYDIILMDHMMPKMDGVETYKKMRSDEASLCRDTPVIMLTANALSGVRERYMDEGFTDYLSKPVRGEKLEAMIKKYLPAELVNDISETAYDEAFDIEPAAEDPAPASGKLSPLIDVLPEMNLKVALPYCCDDEDFLLDILKDFASSTRYEDMLEQFAAEDFENYRINAHSLKSTSLTLGLCGLSERARASEFALKKNVTDFAVMNHEELMEMYKSALDRIRGFLEENEG